MNTLPHTSTRLIGTVALCRLASAPCLAQGRFTNEDVWRNEYRVGQPVEMDPGLSPPPMA